MNPAAATRYQKHCPGCFRLKDGIAVCPHCGYDESEARNPYFLPHGSILGEHYRVGRVLGRPGGFGITYLGWDVNLQQRVAIKEYLPREMAQRLPNSTEVGIHSADDRRNFEFGKEQFLREARIVAKLDHPNIVRVRNFFNANATAYLVMDYYEGMSLGDYLATVSSQLTPELAVGLVQPILEGLQYVHSHGVVHRDLKPHNIYLAAIGRPIVLDFGAARQAAGDRVQSLSIVLTEGYAPLEQYQRRAVQGPWTDVYGVAAMLYRMITGAAPPIALDRMVSDPVEDTGWAAFPPVLAMAMRKALAVQPGDRYQSAKEFQGALDDFLASSSSTSASTADSPLAHAAAHAPVAARSELPTWPAATPVSAPTISLPPIAAIAPRAMPAAPALPPMEPVTRTTLAPFPVAANATPLHRRAIVLPPSPSAAPPVAVPARRTPALLLIFAGLVVGYVLLNPPGSKPKPARHTPAAVAVVEETPVEIAAVVAAPASTVLQIPETVPLPRGGLSMGITEVTFAQFRDFVMRSGYSNPRWQNYPCESAGGRLPDWDNPGYAQQDTSPVVCVSWADAEAYTKWLSSETGQRYRLPTEAEWEYAARGGTSTRYWWGSGFNPDMATCQSCPPKVPTKPSATRTFSANPFGLYEVLGNVREWTCSATDANQCTASESSPSVALRGGSWVQERDKLAVDYRESAPPSRRDVWTGFRIVRE